jgi:hypothetical protein
MRRWFTAVLCGLAVVAPAAGKTAASLRVTSTSPITVAGAGFHPAERVVVVLVETAQFSRTVRATRAGTFTVSFDNAPPPARCSGFTVRANGSRGSRAVAKRPPLPACMPERAP